MSSPDDSHTFFMQAALAQARQAAARGEVPIGAVLVDPAGQVVGSGHNGPVGAQDPTAHAEVMALRDAARRLGNYRLDGCTLYVTLEPCTMCAGAILHARLARVVYAVAEPRTGAAGSVINPFALGQINHQTQVVAAAALGPAGEQWARDCAAMLRDFFGRRRARAKAAREAGHPLRQDAVRAPVQGWDAWPQWQGGRHAHSCFVSDLPSLAGLRLHYLAAARRGPHGEAAGVDWLLLHGHPGWSAGFERTLERLLAQPGTGRVVAPDLIGFGLSDKPKKAAFHQPGTHRQVLVELVRALDLKPLAILAHGVGADLAATLGAELPGRVRGLWALPQGRQARAGDAALPAYAASSEWLGLIARKGLQGAFRSGQGTAAGAWRFDPLWAAPWPDAGHQAAFGALAQWYPAAADAPPPQWLRQPGDAGGPAPFSRLQAPAAASRSPWTTPDDLLAAADLRQAAAYFGT